MQPISCMCEIKLGVISERILLRHSCMQWYHNCLCFSYGRREWRHLCISAVWSIQIVLQTLRTLRQWTAATSWWIVISSGLKLDRTVDRLIKTLIYLSSTTQLNRWQLLECWSQRAVSVLLRPTTEYYIIISIIIISIIIISITRLWQLHVAT